MEAPEPQPKRRDSPLTPNGLSAFIEKIKAIDRVSERQAAMLRAEVQFAIDKCQNRINGIYEYCLGAFGQSTGARLLELSIIDLIKIALRPAMNSERRHIDNVSASQTNLIEKLSMKLLEKVAKNGGNHEEDEEEEEDYEEEDLIRVSNSPPDDDEEMARGLLFLSTNDDAFKNDMNPIDENGAIHAGLRFFKGQRCCMTCGRPESRPVRQWKRKMAEPESSELQEIEQQVTSIREVIYQEQRQRPISKVISLKLRRPN